MKKLHSMQNWMQQLAEAHTAGTQGPRAQAPQPDCLGLNPSSPLPGFVATSGK